MRSLSPGRQLQQSSSAQIRDQRKLLHLPRGFPDFFLLLLGSKAIGWLSNRRPTVHVKLWHTGNVLASTTRFLLTGGGLPQWTVRAAPPHGKP